MIGYDPWISSVTKLSSIFAFIICLLAFLSIMMSGKLAEKLSKYWTLADKLLAVRPLLVIRY
jgi:D-alanyl-lipoteichoic acid acyltransferase DltB (MBOAT superfamily)